MEYLGVIYHTLDIKNRVMIFFFVKHLLTRFFQIINVPDFKIILQNQKSTGIWKETTLQFFS